MSGVLLSGGGGGGAAFAVPPGTSGSVLFANGSGQLAQDNATFFWDTATKRLGIGNAAPTTPLDVTGIARMTNATITAMTLGSLLFAGAAGAVSQDNANFFVDNTNKRIGIGNASPTTALDVTGTTRTTNATVTAMTLGSVLFAGASGAVSQKNAKLFWDNTNDRLGIGNAAPTVPLEVTGTGSFTNVTITAMTLGSILFAGASGAVTQDNANLFFDNANNRLGVGIAAPALALDVVNATAGQACARIRASEATATGYSSIEFQSTDTGVGTTMVFGFVNSGAAKTHQRQLNFLECTSRDFAIGTSIGTAFLFNSTAGAVAMQFASGTSASQSAANTGKLVYSAGGDQAFRVSCNNGAYATIMTQSVAGAMTAGSVVFVAGSSGQLSQDNATFFWDTTNKALGLGLAAPSSTHKLTVKTSATAGHESIKLMAGTTSNYADMVWFDSVPAQKGGIGFGGSALANTLAALNFFYTPSIDWVMSDSTTNYFRWYTTTNSVGYQMANGSGAAASLANTGKLIYTTTGNKFQISHNTAGFFDVATYAAALTLGSIVFANGSNQLAQDNATFFWDTTNKRLGIGNAAPAQALHVTGTGRFTAGVILDTMTLGSIWFTGASGVVSQDNAALFWDNTNKRLGVNDNTPSEALDVTGSINMTVSLFRSGTKVVGARGAAVADASGGAIIDAEARTAINGLLAELRASTGHGLIA